jgi:hypothetical protein
MRKYIQITSVKHDPRTKQMRGNMNRETTYV